MRWREVKEGESGGWWIFRGCERRRRLGAATGAVTGQVGWLPLAPPAPAPASPLPPSQPGLLLPDSQFHSKLSETRGAGARRVAAGEPRSWPGLLSQSAAATTAPAKHETTAPAQQQKRHMTPRKQGQTASQGVTHRLQWGRRRGKQQQHPQFVIHQPPCCQPAGPAAWTTLPTLSRRRPRPAATAPTRQPIRVRRSMRRKPARLRCGGSSRACAASTAPSRTSSGRWSGPEGAWT